MNILKQMKATIGIGLIIMVVFSCKETNETSLEEDTEKILQLHNDQRKYHFEKDSIAFANQQSEHFISVNRGVISSPERDATISRYHGYFSAVEFQKWDDVSEPIIKFSEDRTLAYTIVDKVVAVSYEGEAGDTISDETHFAWTTIYKKYGDQWKIDCVTSTRNPSTEN